MKISKQMDADLEAAANETNSVYLAEPLRADWENADFLDYAHFSAKGSRKLASSIAPRIAASASRQLAALLSAAQRFGRR